MALRNLLGSALAGFGGLIALNRRLRSQVDDLPPALDGRQNRYRWRGIEIAYTEAGDPDDPTLVLLHGINAAGSSGEFREVFEDLSADYHVVAPDLPGFGRSDRPPLQYSARLYTTFVADVLAEFEPEAVIASSLSAAYTLSALTESENHTVDDLLLLCPTAVAGPQPPKQWLRQLIRSPIVGEGLFNLIASKPSIRYFNADHGYYDPSNVTDDWQQYEWQTAHQPNARFAPASFISGYLNSDVNLAAAISQLDCSTTIVWGRDADITPLSEGRELADQADATLIVFDRALLLPHVEFPGQFIEVVDEHVDGKATVTET